MCNIVDCRKTSKKNTRHYNRDYFDVSKTESESIFLWRYNIGVRPKQYFILISVLPYLKIFYIEIPVNNTFEEYQISHQPQHPKQQLQQPQQQLTLPLSYGEPRVMSGNCFSVSSFISFLLIALVTGTR